MWRSRVITPEGLAAWWRHIYFIRTNVSGNQKTSAFFGSVLFSAGSSAVLLPLGGPWRPTISKAYPMLAPIYRILLALYTVAHMIDSQFDGCQVKSWAEVAVRMFEPSAAFSLRSTVTCQMPRLYPLLAEDL